ncbi:MAG TPA: thioredoxin domain-containing protein [Myxococcaceae bacterium]|nr:thioredoxin domain-containing protein [Myxococcaceae bacterium]
MKKQLKQPVATVRAWAPWVLLGLALAEVGLSVFQWIELRTVQAGGTAVCTVNATVNCETVWTSPFAQRVGALSGLPVAGLGVVWGLAAAVCAGALLWRARSGRAVRPAVLPVRTVGAIAAMVCITLVAGSISAGALCLTCLGTYVLVLGYAAVALTALPGALLPASDEWMRALGLPATVVAATWVGLLLLGPARPAKLLPAKTASQAQGGGGDVARFLASRPEGEKQALADALARFARTPAPAQADLLPRARLLKGQADAPVHLVEWTDILCPHCRHLNDALEEVQQSVPPGRLAVEPRQYPLDGACNPDVPQKGDGLRCVGSLALICLEQAPDFWTLRDKLFAAQRTLTRESLLTIASSGSVARGQLEACIASPEAAAKLQDDIRYAELYNPTGTPIVAINGKPAFPSPVFLYALTMASGDPTAPVLTSALPPARRAGAPQ